MNQILDFFTSIGILNIILIVLALIILMMIIQDIFFNKKHTIKHNFPLIGRIRYLLERVGPELRQYIVANNREELPFNRSQRSWIYASSKQQNNYQGFGSDQDFHSPNYIFIKHSMLPYIPPINHPNTLDKSFLPSAKLIGEYNKRKKPYRPASVINISAMSFGSLSARAVESMNRGSHLANCFHNSGEGGVSPYHSKGADVVFQIGTGYFGVRNPDGSFSMDKLVKLVEEKPFIRAIEIKLSQGAKPGKGGVLPAAKISKEISEIRHVPIGKDVLSPASHSAFSNLEEMLDFFDEIAEKTGLPVGFKSAVGKLDMWIELADLMKKTNQGPDFIAVDGGEGGTGAAPPSFANHVSLPFVYGFANVYKIFEERNLTNRFTFIGAGKLGLPSSSTMAFAMGVDIINVAREAMMAVGCIQAQKCQNNSCPAGVATQNKWLQRGINVEDKSHRFYNYVKTLRKEILEITHACGYEHPCQLTMEDIDLSMGDNNYTHSIRNVYGYEKTPVKFENMESLKNCEHLGGNYSKHSKNGN